EALSDRLEWLEHQLGMSRTRLVRLMRVPSSESPALVKQSWADITKTFEPQASRVEHLLTRYLSLFQYDVEKAAAFPREFAKGVDHARLAEIVPNLAMAKTPESQEEALVTVIWQEDASLLPALARFLSVPPETDR